MIWRIMPILEGNNFSYHTQYHLLIAKSGTNVHDDQVKFKSNYEDRLC